MDLWITWDPGGTHADVDAAFPGADTPRGAHRLREGEEYFGIPYAAWRARVGRTVDVPALQRNAHAGGAGTALSLPRASATAEYGGPFRPAPGHALAGAPPHPPPPYGYEDGGHSRACTRDELVERCAHFPATPLVWTPETDGRVPPEAVPFLVDEAVARRLRAHERELRWYGVGLLGSLAVYAVWMRDPGFRSLLVLVPTLCAVGVLGAVQGGREARRAGPRLFPDARRWAEHARWAAAQPARFTHALLWLLIAVAAAQLAVRTDVSVLRAGLVKPAVRDGQLWRLLTATLLHGGFLHLWMNGAALLALGRMVEVHSRRALLPVVFLGSALAGSVASVLLSLAATSVGASGGLMGLSGLLLVLGQRRRDALPLGFRRSVAFGVAATAVLGAVGFAIVDNAAHLGGLAGGYALGRWVDRAGWLEPGRSRALRALAAACALVLLAGALGAAARMHGAGAAACRAALGASPVADPTADPAACR